MRALFFVSENTPAAAARAFLMAARGLIARGHDVAMACETAAPVHDNAAAAAIPVVTLDKGASAAGNVARLRRELRERAAGVVFVHTDAEMLTASSALKLARGGAVIRRIPPFAAHVPGRRARFASRLGATGLLFSTQQDAEKHAPGGHRFPVAVAPLGVDAAAYQAVAPVDRAALGVPADATLIACVHDGSDKARVLSAFRTLALLAPRHPDLHVTVTGDANVDELRMHGAALGINRMVSYADADNSPGVMRAADVGWIAAAGDAAALAALDFMACGVPIVAARDPLTEYYVADGITGVLLPDSGVDRSITAAAVAAFLAKPDGRAAMGKAGQARVARDFTEDAMIAGYERAIAGAGGAAQSVA